MKYVLRNMTPNPILDFEIDKASLQYIGHDLQRPECILAEKTACCGPPTRAEA